MRDRHWILNGIILTFALAALFLFSGTAAAQPPAVPGVPTPADLCQPPRQATFTLDGLSFAGSRQTQELPVGDPVDVLILKPNPFKYAYRVERVEVSRPIAIARDFFTGFGFGDALASLLGAPPKVPAAAPPPACTADNAFALANQQFTKALTDAKDLADAVKKAAADKQDALKDYEKFLEDTNRESLGGSCLEICGRATKLAADLSRAIEPGTLAQDVRKLRDQLATLAKLRTAMTSATAALTGNAKATCEAALPGVFQDADALQKNADTDLPKVDQLLTSLKDKRDELQAFRQLLITVTGDRNAFYEYVTVGARSNRNVKISLIRQDLRSPNATPQVVGFLSFDVPPSGTEDPKQDPLSVAMGIGLSTLDDVKIVRQAASDGSGGSMSAFGYEKSGAFRPSVVGVLNGHLAVWRGTTIAATAGFVLSDRGDSTQLEYLLGPSFGFAGRHVWITPALHIAQIEKLGGGFAVGQKIPEGLQDPLPVEKERQVGFMVAFTYKVR